MSRASPCIAWDGSAEHCVEALLHGAGCCLDGTCVLCRAEEVRLAGVGFDEATVSQHLVATWFTAVSACPRCGFPPPPPLLERPPLPRFARVFGRRLVSAACIVCEHALPRGRRRFCSSACALEYRRAVEGWGYGRAEPIPRVYRAPGVSLRTERA